MKTLVATAILGASLLGTLAFTQDRDGPRMKEPPATELRVAMRRLWGDHLAYSRHYLISSIGGLQDVDDVSKRLVRNQEDLGKAFEAYYGPDAGRRLTYLLRDHIVIAADVVDAARVGGKDNVEAEGKRWTAKAREIAAFFNSVNPRLSQADLEARLQKHIDATTDQAFFRLRKDWAADIQAYDRARDQLLEFSDVITDGLLRQFPDRTKIN